MSSKRNILIALLRNDLRLHDHPIFSQCIAGEQQPAHAKFQNPVTHVLPVYIYDQRMIEVGGLPGLRKAEPAREARTRELNVWRCGSHRTRFVTRSVFDLKSRLESRGCGLSIYAGTPELILPSLIKSIRASGDSVEGVYMCKEVNTEEVSIEGKISKALSRLSEPVAVRMFHTKSLINPQNLPFPLSQLPDVYTQFRKRVEGPGMFEDPLPAPEKLKPFAGPIQMEDETGVWSLTGKSLEKSEEEFTKALLAPLEQDPVLGFIPPAEAAKLPSDAFPYKGGETEALARLEHYFQGGKSAPAATYKETRNGMLGEDYSTKFAAALAHGLLSPRLIAQKATEIDEQNGVPGKGGGYWIIFELLWRDYFFFVGKKFGSNMFKLEGIAAALDSKAPSQSYEWAQPHSLSDKKDAFVKWVLAQTGVPLIDANMKELVCTGFMSNRGRQNVASFLTKDLGYDWRLGAEIFESYLIDYDPNSNWGNWQYVAGVGNDPRSSRQFNPIKQGKDYDASGQYVKAWLPALAHVSDAVAHHPWTLDEDAKPEGYPPRPIVEQGNWKPHYANGARRGGGWRGRGGRGGGGGGGRGGRGRGRGDRGRGGGGGGGGGRGRA